MRKTGTYWKLAGCCLVLLVVIIGIIPVGAQARSPVEELGLAAITIDFHLVSMPQDMQDAIRSGVAENAAQLFPGDRLLVSSVRQEGDWTFATLTLSAQDANDGDMDAPSAFVIVYQAKGGWTVAIEGTPDFAELLAAVPPTMMTTQAKAAFSSASLPDALADPMKMPWRAGQSWKLTQGWHQGNSVDFAPASSEPNKRVLAAHSGTVTSVCDGEASANLKIVGSGGSTTVYVHLEKNSIPRSLLGQFIRQGTDIGKIFEGTYNPGPCGSWQCVLRDSCGNSTGPHLHFDLGTQNAVIDGWTTNSANQWNNGSVIQGVGNWFGSSNQPDSTPPSITFTSHPPTGRWYNTNQRIDWVIADDSSGVRGMSQAWDTQPPGDSQFPGATGGWLDFTSTTEGQHTVKVRAWDNAGNERAAELGWFGYDISRPGGQLAEPPNGSATNTPSWTLRAGAADALSGVKQVTFYATYDGVKRHACTDTAAPYECPWSLPAGVADQNVTFSIDVTDNAENTQPAASSIQVTVDRRAPTGSLVLNNGWGSADGLAMPLGLAADGTGSPVREVRTSADGVNWSAWQPMAAAVWAVLSGQHGGSASAYVQYKDAAGNISAVVNASIALNFYPPRPRSANYAILKDVQAAGGGGQQSPGYRLNGTIGQPIASSGATSPQYRSTWGYWSAQQDILNTFKLFIPLLLK